MILFTILAYIPVLLLLCGAFRIGLYTKSHNQNKCVCAAFRCFYLYELITNEPVLREHCIWFATENIAIKIVGWLAFKSNLQPSANSELCRMTVFDGWYDCYNFRNKSIREIGFSSEPTHKFLGSPAFVIHQIQSVLWFCIALYTDTTTTQMYSSTK